MEVDIYRGGTEYDFHPGPVSRTHINICQNSLLVRVQGSQKNLITQYSDWKTERVLVQEGTSRKVDMQDRGGHGWEKDGQWRQTRRTAIKLTPLVGNM